MVEINEKIEASLMIASYLETIGFKNTEWEFNYKYTVNTSSMYLKIWTFLLHHYMILGGSNILNCQINITITIINMNKIQKGISNHESVNGEPPFIYISLYKKRT